MAGDVYPNALAFSQEALPRKPGKIERAYADHLIQISGQGLSGRDITDMIDQFVSNPVLATFYVDSFSDAIIGRPLGKERKIFGIDTIRSLKRLTAAKNRPSNLDSFFSKVIRTFRRIRSQWQQSLLQLH